MTWKHYSYVITLFGNVTAKLLNIGSNLFMSKRGYFYNLRPQKHVFLMPFGQKIPNWIKKHNFLFLTSPLFYYWILCWEAEVISKCLKKAKYCKFSDFQFGKINFHFWPNLNDCYTFVVSFLNGGSTNFAQFYL